MLIFFLVNNFSPMMSGFVAIVSTLIASALRRSTRIGPKKIVFALEKGAKNAVMVSVACAAAGIIVGMVGLTGVGLKFSSLVVSMSGGIKIIALFLIGAASLVLGMGLPVTASYIVLVILAGPALTDMGVPLVTAHMIVFWYSQDANVTPPVSLASFAAAGVAGANPMRCAFSSWKIAKGTIHSPNINGLFSLTVRRVPFRKHQVHSIRNHRPFSLHRHHGTLLHQKGHLDRNYFAGYYHHLLPLAGALHGHLRPGIVHSHYSVAKIPYGRITDRGASCNKERPPRFMYHVSIRFVPAGINRINQGLDLNHCCLSRVLSIRLVS